LASLLVKYDTRWNDFLKSGVEERLLFPSRDEDIKYLSSIATGTNYDNDDVNRKLPAAKKIIEEFLNSQFENDEQRRNYAKFIYEKVVLVYVTLPKGTDMNWYFEVMNSRGEQLEKHEILKARLLDNVSDDYRFAYSRIWDACSQMDIYLEDTVNSTAIPLILSFDGSERSLNKIIECFDSKNYEGEEPHTLIEILKANKDYRYKENDSHSPKISSITNFSEFLLISYCTFYREIPDKYSEKNLLYIVDFSKESGKSILFIRHLLKTRILFDSFFIKSLLVENHYKWEINCNKRNESSTGDPFVRSKLVGMLSYLQSMINISLTQSEIWLVPFLNFLVQKSEIIYRKEDLEIGDYLLTWLEKFDYQIAQARVSMSKPLKQVAEDNIKNLELSLTPYLVPYNILCNGTSTERYWFFKLDYCLLKPWIKSIPEKHKKNERLINKFQFRQNRSVEHIYPQKPILPNLPWLKEVSDSFGNLALISNSTNSSYNNNTPDAKKIQFQLHNEKWGLESLKLLEIYSYDKWTEKFSEEHQKEMIEKINEQNYSVLNY
jgi:hypothetical protein